MAKRNDILAWCDEVLQVGMFKDYAPNGLQVEGRAEVGKIATSVTASKAAVDFAAEQGADMLLVHHGMFLEKRAGNDYGLEKSAHRNIIATPNQYGGLPPAAGCTPCAGQQRAACR